MAAPRLAFFGTPAFAGGILRGLMAADLTPVVVVSAPDKPVGRKQIVTPSAVSALALEENLPLLRPEKVGTKAFREALRAYAPDLGIVAAYGQVMGPKLLALPRLGMVNVHTSLLPRWRGAAPVQAAILHGDEQTGVTFMQMNEGLDTGPVLRQFPTPVLPEDTPPVLEERLMHLAVDHLPALITALMKGEVADTPQDDAQATTTPKLTKADGWLDFRQPAAALERRVRAMQPWPGARARMGEQVVEILSAHEGKGEDVWQGVGLFPGVLHPIQGTEAMAVATGHGVLVVPSVKPAGKKAMTAGAWLRGQRVESPRFTLPEGE